MTVVDASALAAVAFLEAEADAVRGVIGGQDLAAPRLLPFELANIARNKVRRRPDAALALGEQLRTALAMKVTLHDVDHLEVFALATAHDLTTYDATYLWLARHLQAQLVTLDEALKRAMTNSPKRPSDAGRDR